MSSVNKKLNTLSASKTKVKTKSMSQPILGTGFCATEENLPSRRSSQDLSLRVKPLKRQFELDSEVESKKTVKEMLLKENYGWFFLRLSIFVHPQNKQ